ncbi:VPA1262 family N-terminal domain-containing protein [Pseudomonas sp. S3_A09]
MSVAITVFGVSINLQNPIVCYVLLRSVRGSGAYPKPHLPSKLGDNEAYSTALPDSSATLLVWEKILSSEEEVFILSDMGCGQISIPDECPIAGGNTITGAPFGPLVIDEGAQRTSVTGVGSLCRKGIAGEQIFNEVLKELNEQLVQGTLPKVLQAIILKIGELSGLGEVLESRQVIGVVDFFYRRTFVDGLDGPLFEILSNRPSLRTRDPMIEFEIKRCNQGVSKGYTLHVALSNYDELLKSQLVHFAEDQQEAKISAFAHVTDIEVSVFDLSGELVDKIKNQFPQSIDVGLSVLGGHDLMPPPFRGAKNSADLEARSKIVTSSFEAASIANRSGALDTLRKQAAEIVSLIGTRIAVLENIWFERGMEGQLAVIRWIKKKLEQPSVSEAYLVDPFLGSEAFSRVVARQGNQSAILNIIISPGQKNPDSNSADDTDTNGVSDYLEKLKSTASELCEKLAGKISIFHIKRGGGTKQAFHDRYICIVSNKGLPSVYLLSNSLSKAAGVWPFAICALNQVNSWRVYAYILELVRSNSTSNEYSSELVWDNTSLNSVAVKVSASELQPEVRPPQIMKINKFLQGLREIVVRNSTAQGRINEYVMGFLADLPDGVDTDVFGDALFKVSSHRDAVLALVSSLFRRAGQIRVASILDEKMLDQFLESLPRPDERRISFIPSESRSSVFSNLSSTILRKPNATNFLLRSFNPRMRQLISLIETQRYGYEFDAHEAGLMLAIIALDVAASPTAGSLQSREGLAADYIHWVGRLMRSSVVSVKYSEGGILIPEWSQDLFMIAQRLSDVSRELGSVLDPAFARIDDDPWVSPLFKSVLASSLTNKI